MKKIKKMTTEQTQRMILDVAEELELYADFEWLMSVSMVHVNEHYPEAENKSTLRYVLKAMR